MILKLIVQHCLLIPKYISTPLHRPYINSKDATPFNSLNNAFVLQQCKNVKKKKIIVKFNLIFRKPSWKDGTTATVMVVINETVFIAWLGDSQVNGCKLIFVTMKDKKNQPIFILKYTYH